MVEPAVAAGGAGLGSGFSEITTGCGRGRRRGFHFIGFDIHKVGCRHLDRHHIQ